MPVFKDDIWALGFPFRINAQGGVHLERNLARQAVAQIVICLTTILRERVMRPTYGGDVPSYIFEPNSEGTISSLAMKAEGALQTDVPDVIIRNVHAETDPTEPSRIILAVEFQLRIEVDGPTYYAQLVAVDGRVRELR